MKNFINSLKTLPNRIENLVAQSGVILSLLKNIEKNTNEAKLPTNTPNLLTVARHTLGSIDLKDITDPEEVDNDSYQQYLATAAGMFEFLDRETKWMMKLQHDYWFTQATDWEQAMFGRGTTNGIQLIRDRFELLRNKYIEKTKPEEVPSIGSREDILAKLQVKEVESEPIEE